MIDIPETTYLKVRGAHLACQVFGEGDLDIVLLRTTMNHLDAQWEEPRFAAFMRRLGSFARVIMFDQRGMGMSDPIPSGEFPGLEMWSDDLLAVMDTLGCERATIVACGPVVYAYTFVGSHPERVESFVAIDSPPTLARTDRFPFGVPADTIRSTVDLVSSTWGTDRYPFIADVSPETRKWLARYQRLVASPGIARASFEFLPLLDVTQVIDAIRTPTLVISHAGNIGGAGSAAGRVVADMIPGASFLELPGQTFWFWGYPDPIAVGDEVELFVTGSRAETPITDRVLTTVLFTDIVGSTQLVSSMGDSRWKSVLDDFDRIVTRGVERHHGHLIKSTGDGHLATFDSPGRGIRCANSMVGDVRRLDLQIRAGLHTGEVEVRGGDLGGMAVHIGRRVCDAAGPDEVLVSPTIPTLVAGSGIAFKDHGTRALKGVPGDWQLFQVMTIA